MRLISLIGRKLEMGPKQRKSRPHRKKKLAAVVGVAVAGILVVIVPQFEGVKHIGYHDPVGIPTKCAGDTTDVVVGKRYSEAECRESLQTQLIAHAEPVLECTPSLKGQTYALAAAVSFAYNVGTSAYCNSTMAEKIRAGDLSGACAELSRWVHAGGKKLPGLVKRRANERALCERSL